jgi:hypothetical protein
MYLLGGVVTFFSVAIFLWNNTLFFSTALFWPIQVATCCPGCWLALWLFLF